VFCVKSRTIQLSTSGDYSVMSLHYTYTVTRWQLQIWMCVTITWMWVRMARLSPLTTRTPPTYQTPSARGSCLHR